MSPLARDAGDPDVPVRSWRERWQAMRDRWLASPSFRRRAARSLLTRFVARRRASQVFDLVAGFVYSQVLLACVRLDLFQVLAERPHTRVELAARLGLEPDATERLLAAAVALDLVERRRGERYGLGALGAPLVGNPGLTAMIEHHALLYADLSDPVALLSRGGGERLAAYWPYAGSVDPASTREADVAPYSALMSASQPLVADAILDVVDFRRYRCLLDVGGGDGSFLEAVARCSPDLELILFDLPAVAELASRRFAAARLQARARAVGGSFLVDPLPAGRADIATLVRVLHDHDDARVAALLRAVHRALLPGGTLVIAEPMADTPGAKAMGDAYFGFYLLAMGRGRPRSCARLIEMLDDAGFVDIRPLATAQPLQSGLLLARAPSSKTLKRET